MIGIGVSPFLYIRSMLATWDKLAPSALTATMYNYNTIKLAFTKNTVDGDGHKIERSTDGTNYTEIAMLTGATVTYTDTGLNSLTQYYYRVRAYKDTSYSNYSNVANATTASAAYIIEVDTTKAGSASNTFVLPTTGSSYNAVVDWGDGNTQTITGTPGNVSHTYSVAGVKEIKITGTFPRIYFNNTGDKLKLTKIKNWGAIAWTSKELAYFGCSNMNGTYLDAPNFTGVTNMAYMFADCTSFNQSVSNFNTSNVTNMALMFYNCTSFNQSVSNFNTANVTNMSYMFSSCTSFNQSVSNFNTANVTNMSYMFSGCTSFNQSVSNFNTANVTNMSTMFGYCIIFKQSLATFDIIKVTNFTGMLQNCNINETGTTTNYDNTLISWAAQDPLNSKSINFGTSKYSAAGQTARNTLITRDSWTITDGGLL